jgi:hypothetical protein
LERRVATSTGTTRLPAADLGLISDDLLLLAALALAPAVGTGRH